MTEDGLRIGVDLGGTKISVAALDRANRKRFSARRPTPAGDYTAIVETVRDLVEEARAASGIGGADGAAAAPQSAPVGVGIPGALEADAASTVKNANSQALIGRPLGADLRAALGAKVTLGNDADCFTLSEASDGAGAGAGVVFGVILGTGVGGGVAVGGRPLSGPNRLTGEWGHNPLPFRGAAGPGRACYCGAVDCIEAHLSGPALARSWAEEGHAPRSAEEIAAAAEAGEREARAALERYADALARALATVINLLDPEVIVLGGGLSNIDALYRLTPARWGAHVFHAGAGPAQVKTRLLKNRWGDDSGVRGAAWLAGAGDGTA
ncbi:MAG: ROK family protein [Pseudomonadota bacterium]